MYVFLTIFISFCYLQLSPHYFVSVINKLIHSVNHKIRSVDGADHRFLFKAQLVCPLNVLYYLFTLVIMYQFAFMDWSAFKLSFSMGKNRSLRYKKKLRPKKN